MGVEAQILAPELTNGTGTSDECTVVGLRVKQELPGLVVVVVAHRLVQEMATQVVAEQ